VLKTATDCEFWVVIPARYASSRLPGKPLRDIAGYPMLWHVYKHAVASGATQVIIATDDERIYNVAKSMGAKACMTSPAHCSGTDRIAETVQHYNLSEDEIVVNVQGDEPLLPPVLIRQVAQALHNQSVAQVATLCEPITEIADVFNPHCVKVVLDKQGFALYFSRAPLPWQRDTFAEISPTLRAGLHFRHIGIYAYRVKDLLQNTQLPPCPLEQTEALEQLRVLFNGGKIYVEQAVVKAGIGVDTIEDLTAVRQLVITEDNHPFPASESH
jgi:3-deoxy-manno-octulosonate cytidylyltransferase (CMP-KDO synthetase)